jgi:hypothetical protein
MPIPSNGPGEMDLPAEVNSEDAEIVLYSSRDGVQLK